MANFDEQIKFLSLDGLQLYDEKIKEVIEAGDSDLQDLIDLLNNESNVEGSIANSINTALDNLDYDSTDDDGHVAGKAIVAVALENGQVSATEGAISGTYVTYTPQVVTEAVGTEGEEGYEPAVYDTAQTTIQGVLAEVYNKIDNNAAAGEVAVYNGNTPVNAITADGNTYTIKQGSNTVATINIARDMVVSSGSVVSYTSEQITALTDVPDGTTLIPNEKYVRLVIANATNGKNIYIAVNDLYDDYTFTDGDEIDFTESGNEVTASIKDGSIAKSKLTTALLTEISAAATTATEKSTGHVTLSYTAASGATPANILIEEDDIASAAYVGTIPNGATATTVIGYSAEVAAAAQAAAEAKATRITVNGNSQNSNSGAITVTGDDIVVKEGTASTQLSVADSTTLLYGDTIDLAFRKVLKKFDNINAIEDEDIEELFGDGE